MRFLLVLLLAVPLVARAAAPVATNIANFPSVSVHYTNYLAEGIVTNGLTLGGVRKTAWPVSILTNNPNTTTTSLANNDPWQIVLFGTNRTTFDLDITNTAPSYPSPTAIQINSTFSTGTNSYNPAIIRIQNKFPADFSSTDSDLWIYGGDVAIGVWSDVAASETAADKVGAFVSVHGSSVGGVANQAGIVGLTSGSSLTNIGTAGISLTAGRTNRVSAAGYFVVDENSGTDGWDSPNPNIQNAVLLLDNNGSGFPLLVVRTNNGTKIASIEADGSFATDSTIQAKKAFQPYQGTLTHAGSVALDFDGTTTVNSITLTGALTVTFSNLNTNRTYRLKIQNAQATNCTLTLPSGVHGYYTTTLSNGWHMASFESWGSVASNVWVSTSSDGTY